MKGTNSNNSLYMVAGIFYVICGCVDSSQITNIAVSFVTNILSGSLRSKFVALKAGKISDIHDLYIYSYGEAIKKMKDQYLISVNGNEDFEPYKVFFESLMDVQGTNPTGYTNSLPFEDIVSKFTNQVTLRNRLWEFIKQNTDITAYPEAFQYFLQDRLIQSIADEFRLLVNQNPDANRIYTAWMLSIINNKSDSQVLALDRIDGTTQMTYNGVQNLIKTIQKTSCLARDEHSHGAIVPKVTKLNSIALEPDTFATRINLTNEINQFIKDTNKLYMLIQSPFGWGKKTLIRKTLEKSDVEFHVFDISYVDSKRHLFEVLSKRVDYTSDLLNEFDVDPSNAINSLIPAYKDSVLIFINSDIQKEFQINNDILETLFSLIQRGVKCIFESCGPVLDSRLPISKCMRISRKMIPGINEQEIEDWIEKVVKLKECGITQKDVFSKAITLEGYPLGIKQLLTRINKSIELSIDVDLSNEIKILQEFEKAEEKIRVYIDYLQYKICELDAVLRQWFALVWPLGISNEHINEKNREICNELSVVGLIHVENGHIYSMSILHYACLKSLQTNTEFVLQSVFFEHLSPSDKEISIRNLNEKIPYCPFFQKQILALCIEVIKMKSQNEELATRYIAPLVVRKEQNTDYYTSNIELLWFLEQASRNQCWEKVVSCVNEIKLKNTTYMKDISWSSLISIHRTLMQILYVEVLQIEDVRFFHLTVKHVESRNEAWQNVKISILISLSTIFFRLGEVESAKQLQLDIDSLFGKLNSYNVLDNKYYIYLNVKYRLLQNKLLQSDSISSSLEIIKSITTMICGTESFFLPEYWQIRLIKACFTYLELGGLELEKKLTAEYEYISKFPPSLTLLDYLLKQKPLSYKDSNRRASLYPNFYKLVLQMNLESDITIYIDNKKYKYYSLLYQIKKNRDNKEVRSIIDYLVIFWNNPIPNSASNHSIILTTEFFCSDYNLDKLTAIIRKIRNLKFEVLESLITRDNTKIMNRFFSEYFRKLIYQYSQQCSDQKDHESNIVLMNSYIVRFAKYVFANKDLEAIDVFVYYMSFFRKQTQFFLFNLRRNWKVWSRYKDQLVQTLQSSNETLDLYVDRYPRAYITWYKKAEYSKYIWDFTDAMNSATNALKYSTSIKQRIEVYELMLTMLVRSQYSTPITQSRYCVNSVFSHEVMFEMLDNLARANPEKDYWEIYRDGLSGDKHFWEDAMRKVIDRIPTTDREFLKEFADHAFQPTDDNGIALILEDITNSERISRLSYAFQWASQSKKFDLEFRKRLAETAFRCSWAAYKWVTKFNGKRNISVDYNFLISLGIVLQFSNNIKTPIILDSETFNSINANGNSTSVLWRTLFKDKMFNVVYSSIGLFHDHAIEVFINFIKTTDLPIKNVEVTISQLEILHENNKKLIDSVLFKSHNV